MRGGVNPVNLFQGENTVNRLTAVRNKGVLTLLTSRRAVNAVNRLTAGSHALGCEHLTGEYFRFRRK